MPLVPPVLDQRTFEQLVTEVRRRVPAFTPEWTDLNDSDPGITLAQLFAFMTEQLLFQVNQVPEKGLITFLQLVGAELHPATPAVADVTFSPSSVPVELEDQGAFILSPGTRVATAGPPPGQKRAISFETTISAAILHGELAVVASRDCDRALTLHPENEELSASFLPLGPARSTEDELLLGFRLAETVDGGWPSENIRLRINLKDSLDVGEPPRADPSASAILAQQPEPRLVWSYATGLDVVTQEILFTDFEPVLDSTNEFTRSGYIEVRLDETQVEEFARLDPIDGQESVPEELAELAGLYIIRARLARPDAYSDQGPPQFNTVRVNTVPAIAVESVRAAENGDGAEFLGSSTGLPFQRFQLANAPVIPKSAGTESTRMESTRIEVIEAGVPVEWEEVGDIFTASPTQRAYQLFPATGEILFGNGEFGRIPPPDDGTVPGGNVRATLYQFGGGIAGNVGAETLTNVTTIEESLPEFDATNVLPAALGAEEEPLERGIARAPAVVRSRFRAVSAEDFAALAQETPAVRIGRAMALANTRPGILPGRSPGSVTVKVVPDVPFVESQRGPILAQPSVVAAVLDYLNERRLITTELFVDSASFRQVRVDASVRVDPRFSVAETQSAALLALRRFFHALVGGVDGMGWPFGGTVHYSRVFELLVNVDGVTRVDDLNIALDDEEFAGCEVDWPLRPGELLFSEALVIAASLDVG